MKIKGFKSKMIQEEVDQAIELMENPYAWEHYCNACDHFRTNECPFKDKVDIATNWKQLGCDNFWD